MEKSAEDRRYVRRLLRTGCVRKKGERLPHMREVTSHREGKGGRVTNAENDNRENEVPNLEFET